MRDRVHALVGWVVLVAAVGLVVWAFIEATKAQPAVVGAVATAGLGVAGVIWQQRQSEHARLREAHRDRMTPVYHELLKRVWQHANQGGQEPAEDVAEFMRDLKSRQLILGAPSEMILAFNRWERDAAVAKLEGDGRALVFAWETFLFAVRRDLGHDDSGLSRGDLLRVFMDDVDTFLPEPDAVTAVAAVRAAEGDTRDGSVQ